MASGNQGRNPADHPVWPPITESAHMVGEGYAAEPSWFPGGYYGPGTPRLADMPQDPKDDAAAVQRAATRRPADLGLARAVDPSGR